MGIKEREEAYKLYLKDNSWKNPKILRNSIGISSILNHTNSKPLHVTIDPIESCNHRCGFCVYHGKKNKFIKNSTFNGKGVFPFDRLVKLIDELKSAGTEAISFTGTGETLLYPNIYTIFQKIVNNGMEYGITTNLDVKISDENIDILSKASWIRCSLNASNNELYKSIHKPLNMNDGINRVLDNIRLLPNINISYVITDTNISDIVDATRLVKNLGVNSIFFRLAIKYNGNDKGKKCNHAILLETINAKKLETKTFKVYNASESINTNHDLLCYYSNHTAYIDSYGDVYPCCITKCNKKYAYGNIMNQHFKQFWDSRERRENYKKINMKSCPPCIHYIDNSTLELLYNNDKISNKFI